MSCDHVPREQQTQKRWLGLRGSSLQLIDELRRFAMHMSCEFGIENALDPTRMDTIFEEVFEINDLFGCEQDFAARQHPIAVCVMKTFEQGARVERRTDEILLSRIEQMRDDLAFVACSARPEIDDFGVIERDISGRQCFQPCHGALGFPGRVIEEEREYKRSNFSRVLRVAHAPFIFCERLDQIDGQPIQCHKI